MCDDDETINLRRKNEMFKKSGMLKKHVKLRKKHSTDHLFQSQNRLQIAKSNHPLNIPFTQSFNLKLNLNMMNMKHETLPRHNDRDDFKFIRSTIFRTISDISRSCENESKFQMCA